MNLIAAARADGTSPGADDLLPGLIYVRWAGVLAGAAGN